MTMMMMTMTMPLALLMMIWLRKLNKIFEFLSFTSPCIFQVFFRDKRLVSTQIFYDSAVYTLLLGRDGRTIESMSASSRSAL